MTAHTLNILTPSVNNLTVRIFMRAAGLDFEELDVWGKTTSPEFMEKYPAHLTPMLEEEGLPKGALGESCAIMQYLCNKHGLDQFYPRDPAQRAAEAALAEPLDVYRAFFLDGKPFIGGDSPSIADFRFAATLEFLRAIDYEFPGWAEEYMTRMEETLGEAYAEPAADVRAYVASVKSPSPA